ncbi:MFS transporter [Rhodococcus sp. IEGM1300]
MSAALGPVAAVASSGLSCEMIAARLDRLPASKSLWRFVTLLALGGFFETFEMFSTSFVLPGIVRSGVLVSTTEGFFALNGAAAYIAATFIGLFIGTLGFGMIADKFGRRAVFTYALLGYALCSLIMACQTDALGLNFWRLMTAIGLGVEVIAIDAYLSEVVPPTLRGRAFAINRIMSYLAVPVCGITAYLFVPHEPLGIDGWRWVIAIGAVGSLLVWVLRRKLPESARWLADKGRLEEADAEVSRMERAVEKETGKPLPAAKASVKALAEHTTRFSELWGPRYRTRTIMLVIFHVFQAMGIYGFLNWAPTFLIEQGVTVSKSLAYTVVMGCSAPLGPVLALFFADRIERKWQIVFGAMVIAVAGVAFAEFRLPLLIIACGALLTMGTTILSVGYHAYQSELYPTRIRAMAVGFVYSTSRVGGSVSGFMIAFTLGHFGVQAALLSVGACMMIVALAVALLGPLTRGRTLEEIND